MALSHRSQKTDFGIHKVVQLTTDLVDSLESQRPKKHTREQSNFPGWRPWLIFTTIYHAAIFLAILIDPAGAARVTYVEMVQEVFKTNGLIAFGIPTGLAMFVLWRNGTRRSSIVMLFPQQFVVMIGLISVAWLMWTAESVSGVPLNRAQIVVVSSPLALSALFHSIAVGRHSLYVFGYV